MKILFVQRGWKDHERPMLGGIMQAHAIQYNLVKLDRCTFLARTLDWFNHAFGLTRTRSALALIIRITGEVTYLEVYGLVMRHAQCTRARAHFSK